jgi:hypothetical protein
MKAVLAVVSDLHINSTVALSKPLLNLDDGGTYYANRTQRWLWDNWLSLWNGLGIQYDTSWRRILVINGDMGELDTKRRSVQLITPNTATIQRLVIDTISPAVDWANQIYIIRGTPAHVGKSAWLEEAIAADLDNVVRYHQEAPASWWHLRATCEGVRLDIAHHASMGGRPWTRQNAANGLAAKIIWQYEIDRKQPAPQLIIRSHNHTCVSARMNGTEVWFTPSWTTLTEHGYRGGFENELAHIGAVVCECEAGEQKSYKIMYEPKDNRKLWALKM